MSLWELRALIERSITVEQLLGLFVVAVIALLFYAGRINKRQEERDAADRERSH
jgi:hypothetical protein